MKYDGLSDDEKGVRLRKEKFESDGWRYAKLNSVRLTWRPYFPEDKHSLEGSHFTILEHRQSNGIGHLKRSNTAYNPILDVLTNMGALRASVGSVQLDHQRSVHLGM